MGLYLISSRRAVSFIKWSLERWQNSIGTMQNFTVGKIILPEEGGNKIAAL